MTETPGEGPPAADRPPPLSPEEVTETLRRCLTAGTVIPTKHFRDPKQQAERNYTIQDAINVLRWGEVSTEPPQWNGNAERWGYRVYGPDLEGDVLTVVVSIEPNRDQVWLVTAF